MWCWERAWNCFLLMEDLSWCQMSNKSNMDKVAFQMLKNGVGSGYISRPSKHRQRVWCFFQRNFWGSQWRVVDPTNYFCIVINLLWWFLVTWSFVSVNFFNKVLGTVFLFLTFRRVFLFIFKIYSLCVYVISSYIK